MLRRAVPVLHIDVIEAAEAFYTGAMGFERTFAYQPDPERRDPAYAGFERDGVELHISSFSGDGVSGGVVMLYVEDVDLLHAEFTAKGVAIHLEPTDQTWGIREMYVRDPSANTLRFASAIKT